MRGPEEELLLDNTQPTFHRRGQLKKNTKISASEVTDFFRVMSRLDVGVVGWPVGSLSRRPRALIGFILLRAACVSTLSSCQSMIAAQQPCMPHRSSVHGGMSCPSLAAPQPSLRKRCGPIRCEAPSNGAGNLLNEVLKEATLERQADLVELPVMFVSADDSSRFDFARWDKHRSPDRYYRLLIGLFLSVTTRRIAPAVLSLMAFSLAVSLYGQETLSNPTLPELQLPLTPFELTAPVLGLLLVFRSDNAYARFRDGSEVAWQMSTSIRTAIRRLLAWTSAPHVPDDERAAAKELIAGCIHLHAWIMKEHLRSSGSDGGQEGPAEASAEGTTATGVHADVLRAALGPSVAAEMEGCGQPSPYLGVEAISLGAAQRLPSLTDQELIAIDESLATVTEDLGRCESLLRTPIPLGYTRYSVRFLWVWLTLLPFALTRTFADFEVGTWWEGKLDEPWPLLVTSITFIGAIFLSIEDIAVQIEEPFAILPLDFHHQWLLRDVEQSYRLMEAAKRGRTSDAPMRAARTRK